MEAQGQTKGGVLVVSVFVSLEGSRLEPGTENSEVLIEVENENLSLSQKSFETVMVPSVAMYLILILMHFR